MLGVAGGLAGWALAGSLPLFSPPSQIDSFGYVASVTPKGNGYLLRFDPAVWLEGETATVAAIEDGEIKPGEAVANDYYIRNPEHSPSRASNRACRDGP